VWVDGAVFNAGTRRQVGAYGVYVEDGHEENAASFVRHVDTPPHKMTNQYMELYAAHAGMQAAARLAEKHQHQDKDYQSHESAPTVYTTSVHVVNCINKWAPIWERTGYVTKNKRPVQHTDMLRAIRTLQKVCNGRFVCTRTLGNDARHGHHHRQASLLAAQAAAEGGRIGCSKQRVRVLSDALLR
jgi:ribonuclease HI